MGKGSGIFRKGSRLLGAVAATAALALVPVGAAGAAPADRGTDPVVMKGSAVSGLLGTAPEQIVAFRWDGGGFQQVPVQVDERKTIDARTLYPYGSGTPPYVGNDNPAFQIEVYADPDTRAGADDDAALDGDDEIVFMGKDSGPAAPAQAAMPAGVDPASATDVTVADGLGGGEAHVYLFRSTGGLDPSAGKRYVDYDFNLTNLGPGETIAEGYEYLNSPNPEDSTVSTQYYTLHSTDRWMEDGMAISAGGASGADILDREVAQAFRTVCGRTQYTFSGNWTASNPRGGDSDEGTLVTIKSGPVRAIRSYMGANSGPYTQREHIYYEQSEDNRIYLRVHPMADLYSWTDYSAAAIGMTYRDSENTGGVAVDGNPETLPNPADSAALAAGELGWQQMVGPQGSVNTVVGVTTDIPGALFGTYYLDDSTPVGANEVQCGGDGQSIGASGFGILGTESGPITPNTDPRATPFNNLTVSRTRYFDGPGAGAAEADRYMQRVDDPLTATAAPYGGPIVIVDPPIQGKPRLKAKVGKKRIKVPASGKVRARVRVTNTGDVPLTGLKACFKSKRVKNQGCTKAGRLAEGASKTIRRTLRVKKPKPGAKATVRVTITAQGMQSPVKRSLRLRVKG